MNKSALTGIVLAGGKSIRMGKDKGLVSFKGRAMVEYPLEVLTSFCNHVLISTNNSEYSRYGYPLVCDRFEFRAPLNGIYSALAASTSTHNLVIATDMPLISIALLKRILNHAEGYDMVVPAWPDGKTEPLCGYYNKGLLPAFSQQISSGTYSIQELTSGPNCFKMPIIPDEKKLFINLNHPHDIEQYG